MLVSYPCTVVPFWFANLRARYFDIPAKRHHLLRLVLDIVNRLKDSGQFFAGDLFIRCLLERTETDGHAFPHRPPRLVDDILPIETLPIRRTAILAQPDTAGLKSLASQFVLSLSADPGNSLGWVQRSIGTVPLASPEIERNAIGVETDFRLPSRTTGRGSVAPFWVRLYTQLRLSPIVAQSSLTVRSGGGPNGWPSKAPKFVFTIQLKLLLTASNFDSRWGQNFQFTHFGNAFVKRGRPWTNSGQPQKYAVSRMSCDLIWNPCLEQSNYKCCSIHQPAPSESCAHSQRRLRSAADEVRS
jgi:hypothetical protein